MKDVRVSGLSRGTYEPPELMVVSIAGGRLLSASQWNAQAFGNDVSFDWNRSEAQAFGNEEIQGGEWDDLP